MISLGDKVDAFGATSNGVSVRIEKRAQELPTFWNQIFFSDVVLTTVSGSEISSGMFRSGLGPIATKIAGWNQS